MGGASADLAVAKGHEDLAEQQEREAGELVEVTCIGHSQRLPQLPLGVVETTRGEGEESADVAEGTLETLAAVDQDTHSTETTPTNHGSRDSSSIRVHTGHEGRKLRLFFLANLHEADGKVEGDKDPQFLTVCVLRRGTGNGDTSSVERD